MLLNAAAIWINKQTYAHRVPPHTAYSSELNFTLHCFLRQFRQADANSRKWRDNAFIYRLFGRRGDLSDCVHVCVSDWAHACVYGPMHLYVTETHWREAREMWFSPGEMQKERGRERKRETTCISRGIVFLVTHPVFVPELRRRVGGGHETLHVHREANPTVSTLTNKKWLQWSRNTSRPAVATAQRKWCTKMYMYVPV